MLRSDEKHIKLLRTKLERKMYEKYIIGEKYKEITKYPSVRNYELNIFTTFVLLVLTHCVRRSARSTRS